MAMPHQFRVRQIIGGLDYSELVRKGIIPRGLFQEKVVTATLPKWAYLSVEHFGIFVEELLRHFTTMKIPSADEKNVNLIYKKVYETEKDIPNFDVNKGLWWKFCHFSKRLREYGKCIYDAQYSSGLLTGHPDIITEATILDVKTTRNFAAMRKATILQLLAYYALHNVDAKYKSVPVAHRARIVQLARHYAAPWSRGARAANGDRRQDHPSADHDGREVIHSPSCPLHPLTIKKKWNSQKQQPKVHEPKAKLF